MFSLGCFSLSDDGNSQQLISMVVGEEQSLAQVESDVGPLLASAAPTTTAMYIISLGMYRVIFPGGGGQSRTWPPSTSSAHALRAFT